MNEHAYWLLPDGVDELLPPEAWRLEGLRRRLLDLCTRWGYAYVIPPVVEYLDSLLSGIGEDLELQTFKLTDPASGRLLGVRADITPQVARIDAHRLPAAGVQRLCYVGPVVHAMPEKFAGSRNPLQIGAELYGHAGIDGDVEIIALLLEALAAAGIAPVTLELGHMGLFHALCESAHFDHADESRLLNLLLMKDASGLSAALNASGAAAAVERHLHALLELNGDISVMARARHLLRDAPKSAVVALDEVERLTQSLERRVPGADLHLDFAELRGYRYHTGIMFAAYTPAHGRAIAWGGRYDNIGRAFGRPRAATGFSTDLKVLVALGRQTALELPRLFAPANDSPTLDAAVRDYRAAGYVVVRGLPGQPDDARALGCEQRLIEGPAGWQLEDVGAGPAR